VEDQWRQQGKGVIEVVVESTQQENKVAKGKECRGESAVAVGGLVRPGEEVAVQDQDKQEEGRGTHR